MSSKRKRSISECSNENGSPVKIKKKRKSSIEEKLLSDYKVQLQSHDNKTENKTEEITSKKDKIDKKAIVNTETTEKKDNIIKKKNRKHSKKDKEVKEIVVPPLYVISKYKFFFNC